MYKPGSLETCSDFTFLFEAECLNWPDFLYYKPFNALLTILHLINEKPTKLFYMNEEKGLL